MRVTLVGTGCGSIGTMTASAIYALEQADLIIGAPRLIESFPAGWGDRRSTAVSSVEIMDAIHRFDTDNPDIPWNGNDFAGETGKKISVAFSGDTGFYSGARALLPLLQNEGIETDVIPGISSLQLLAARLDMPWQDWKLVSAHGTDCDAASEIDGSRHTFFLTGGKMGPSELCMQISEAGFGELQVAVAERLSYDDERIMLGGARDFTGESFDSLSVLLVWPTGIREEMPHPVGDDAIHEDVMYHSGAVETYEDELHLQDLNQIFGDPEEILFGETAGLGSTIEVENPEGYAPQVVPEAESMKAPAEETGRYSFAEYRPGLPDSCFIRGDVPMTKRDIRAVIAGHMQTGSRDTIWDVGAGTGSVTVELAMQASGGRVFAVEKDPEGILLIKQNLEEFGLGNAEVIEGHAPEALRNLPAPDRVFIGGSDGNMREIIETALEKNPGVMVCVTAILLETAVEALAVMDFLGMDGEMTQVSVSTARKAKDKHMMIAGNPIFIITGTASEDHPETEISEIEE